MSRGAGFTTPDDLADELRRLWARGRLLGATTFPLELPLRGPSARQMLEDFEGVRQWIRALEAGSAAARGFGYTLVKAPVAHRQLGRNDIPVAAHIATEDDALRLAGKLRDARAFAALREHTAKRCPELLDWLDRKALRGLEHAEDWPRLLEIVRWFQANPRSGRYLRQIDVPGVHTKFIESRRALLSELLDAALPAESVDTGFTAGAGFEARYGLRPRPALLRFRILDPRQHLRGLGDLTVPVEAFGRLDHPARRVLIVENDVTGLALPELPETLAIFGLGYSLDRLAPASWLTMREVHYWGDLDTHGFAMLSRLRGLLPEARSLMMDRETLLSHRDLWVREEKPNTSSLDHLTPPEAALYEDLRDDRLGVGVRLEQERIGFGWVEAALRAFWDA